MSKSIFRKRCVAARSSRGSVFIEGLESRQLMSASPVHLSPVTPGKILAPNTGYEKVTIHNTTAAPVTEAVTITLTPYLAGTSTPAGTYSSAPFSETVTLNKHGSTMVKVPFTPPITLVQGKYRTQVAVNLAGQEYDGFAPGTYTLTIPPAATITPSLVGHYVGTLAGSAGTGEGGTITHEYGIIWQTTSQTLTSLTGTFYVGDQNTAGTMTGQESTNGTVTYTLASDLMDYTLTGKVNSAGTLITGTIHGTLVNNLFKRIDGHFKLTLNPD